MKTDTPAQAHSEHPEWHSGGLLPGSDRWSAYTDYRWQCSCGRRYGDTEGEWGVEVGALHAVHLAEVERSAQFAA